MKKDLKSILQLLEVIEDSKMSQLQGGFISISILAETNSVTSDTTNNCKGGNCNTNNCSGGNCITGCGTPK
jgi:hypothetical protein